MSTGAFVIVLVEQKATVLSHQQVQLVADVLRSRDVLKFATAAEADALYNQFASVANDAWN